MIASALMMPALRRTWPSIESPSRCLNLQLGISPSPVGQSCKQIQHVDPCTSAEAALTRLRFPFRCRCSWASAPLLSANPAGSFRMLIPVQQQNRHLRASVSLPWADAAGHQHLCCWPVLQAALVASEHRSRQSQADSQVTHIVRTQEAVTHRNNRREKGTDVVGIDWRNFGG